MSAYSKLGKAIVDSYYPKDHTHTNTDGAITVAQAFISGLGRQDAKGVFKLQSKRHRFTRSTSDAIPITNTSRV